MHLTPPQNDYHLIHRLQIPGLIIEPVIFTAICYFLVELRPTVYAFVLTSVLAVFVMNIATACGIENENGLLKFQRLNFVNFESFVASF